MRPVCVHVDCIIIILKQTRACTLYPVTLFSEKTIPLLRQTIFLKADSSLHVDTSLQVDTSLLHVGRNLVLGRQLP